MTYQRSGAAPSGHSGAEDRCLRLERRLSRVEVALDRTERWLWLAVYGAASLIVAEIAFGLLSLTVS